VLILCLKERQGLFLVTKVADKTSKATALVIQQRMKELPRKMKKTITFDNGTENSDWKTIEKETGMKTFFCSPISFMGERSQ